MAKVKATKKATKSAKKATPAKKAVKASAKKTAAPKKAAAPKKPATAKRTLNPALKAPYTPSAQLAEIVGSSPLPRQEVVSKLWKYIKKNGLQDKQNINADDKLQAVFGKPQVTMFEMQKYISKHLTK